MQQGKSLVILLDGTQPGSNGQPSIPGRLSPPELRNSAPKYAPRFVHVLLAGQQPLQGRLRTVELRPLDDSISNIITLHPLSKQESFPYLQHQMDQVLMTKQPVFTKDAMKQITSDTQGVSYQLNFICTEVLIYGMRHNQSTNSARLVHQVITHFKDRPSW